MFCAPGLIFDGTEGVVSRFHVLGADSFSAIPRASGPDFKFCAPRLIFGDTDGDGSRFNVLRARTHFRRYRGRRVPFSSSARRDSFSAIPRASGPVFMFCETGLVIVGTEGVGTRFFFCAPGLVFGGAEGVVSLFHVLHARTRFRR
jgi:hypothetical protein